MGNQLRHPRYAAPELLATRPNEVWSWDITKLLGPAKWTYFYLYVILDIFSRCKLAFEPDRDQDTVSVIDTATFEVIRVLPFKKESKPHMLTVSPKGKFLWVEERDANVVSILDVSTFEVVKRIPVRYLRLKEADKRNPGIQNNRKYGSHDRMHQSSHRCRYTYAIEGKGQVQHDHPQDVGVTHWKPGSGSIMLRGYRTPNNPC